MCAFYSPYISTPPIPPAGAYGVHYNSRTLTFNVPDQTNVTNYLAMLVPTVVLNANGTINKIIWEYKLSNGSASVDPKALVDTIGIEITAIPQTGPPSAQVYSVYNLPSGTTEHTLTNQSIIWANVTNIGTSYYDVFGDNISVTWSRP
jgi:hypothetical protein